MQLSLAEQVSTLERTTMRSYKKVLHASTIAKVPDGAGLVHVFASACIRATNMGLPLTQKQNGDVDASAQRHQMCLPRQVGTLTKQMRIQV